MWGQGTFESSALSSTSTKAVVLSITKHARLPSFGFGYSAVRTRASAGIRSRATMNVNGSAAPGREMTSFTGVPAAPLSSSDTAESVRLWGGRSPIPIPTKLPSEPSGQGEAGAPMPVEMFRMSRRWLTSSFSTLPSSW